MKFRYYDKKKDTASIQRIWQEAGWIGHDEQEEKALANFLEGGKVFISDIRGEAECMTQTMDASMRYLSTDLPLAAITAVLTSMIARKQGLAGKLTATAIAEAAEEGAALAGLGMFEQGFYNRLGLGTGTYENFISFDPATLRIPDKAGTPHRIGKGDWQKVHESRLNRLRLHGACNIFDPHISRFEMEAEKESFGLGYYDKSGKITHHLFGKKKGEHGPFQIYWMSYQNYSQLMELLSLLKNLSDQIHLVKLHEPAGIQIQDLLSTPFRYRHLTEKSNFESSMKSLAYWQMRICDLRRCIEAAQIKGRDIAFDLQLNDPIEQFLKERNGWKGIGGEYTVHLGEHPGLEPGLSGTLPLLKASVNSFTRLWLGVRSASALSVLGDLSGPLELLAALDEELRIPLPHTEWEF